MDADLASEYITHQCRVSSCLTIRKESFRTAFSGCAKAAGAAPGGAFGANLTGFPLRRAA
ncbi:hypothetical protein AXG89_11950 [Burkholderia sp. PAMC 26561]|nr:hypothetical protein AXG89_11950 [Burkholderia sp. PAMC 26561]